MRKYINTNPLQYIHNNIVFMNDVFSRNFNGNIEGYIINSITLILSRNKK